MVKVVIGTKVCSFEEMLEEYGRVCEENVKLKEQLNEQTELADYWYEKADQYEDVLYIKAENSGYYDMTLQKFIELNQIVKEQKKQIAELESELAKKETLLKIREDWCEECKEKSAIEKLKETPLFEEPLPLSCEECEKEVKTELPTMPIDVASMLINATVEYPTPSIYKAFGAGEISFADKYSKSDLREIAEHLLVYCNNSDEDDIQN